MTPTLLFAVLPIVAVILILLLTTLLVKRSRKKIPPRNAYMEGLRWLVEDNEKKALSSLKSAISEDPSNVDAFVKLGDLLRRRGYYDKALQVHQQLTVRPGLSRELRREIYWGLAQDYVGLGRNQKAISLLKELISLGRRDNRLLATLLHLYEKEGRWDEAIETRKVLLQQEGKDPSLLALYYAWVGERVRSQDVKKGTALLRHALKIDSGCVLALIALGDSFYDDGNTEQAIANWRRVVDQVPNFAFLTFSRLEKAYFDEKRFGEVEKMYEELLTKDPTDVRVLSALAEIFEKKGDAKGALDVYRTMLDLDPSSAIAASGLIDVYRESGELEKAAEQARALAELVLPKQEGYICSNCGYTASDYLWLCPKCDDWKTFR